MGAYISTELDGAKEGYFQFQNMGREVEMSLNIARARDRVQWLCGGYAGILTAATLVTIKQRAFPKVLGPPIFVGGLVIANMADMAYGTKLKRVIQEAEYIMEHEKELLVPPKTTPFHKFYDEIAEKDKVRDVNRVSSYWPSFISSHLPRQGRDNDKPQAIHTRRPIDE